MKGRESFFSKNNFDSALEELLERKYFNDEIKSLILNIVYKIENAYGDYSKIKYDVKFKSDIVSEITHIIEDKCDNIEIMNPNNKKIKYEIDKKTKTIKTFPNETPLLQAIYDISTKDVEGIKNVINKVVTKLVNKGRALDGAEIIRDFNGWSWTHSIEDNMSKFYNLMYQSLIILMGRANVEFAVNALDTREVIENKIRELYVAEESQKIIKNFEICCILIYIKNSQERYKEVQKYIEKLNKKLEFMENKPRYIASITKKNDECLKIIGAIENILKNKKLLEAKYLKPEIKEKYKMIDNYKKYLKDIQQQRLKQINKNSKLINPSVYKKNLDKIKYEIKLLNEFNSIHESKDSIYNSVNVFEKSVIASFNKKLDSIEIKKDFINMVYELRYYNYLPVRNDRKIKDVKDLEVELRNIQTRLISKLTNEKMIETFSNDEDNNYQILKYIFTTKTTNMSKLYIKLKNKEKGLCVEYYDENELERESDISFNSDNVEEVSKKTDKKIKIFL